MRVTIGLIVMALAWQAAAAPPPPLTIPVTTKPTSRPAAKPKQAAKVMNGAVRFMVPADWEEDKRDEADKWVQFKSPDDVSTMLVLVTPQEYPIPTHKVNFIEQMKTIIINGMKKEMQAKGQEILYGPRSETDDRFLLRIHTRSKEGHVVMDSLHVYRAAGLDLLMVSSIVKTDKPAEAAPIHTMAEDTCLSIVLGKADKRPEKTNDKK